MAITRPLSIDLKTATVFLLAAALVIVSAPAAQALAAPLSAAGL